MAVKYPFAIPFLSVLILVVAFLNLELMLIMVELDTQVKQIRTRRASLQAFPGNLLFDMVCITHMGTLFRWLTGQQQVAKGEAPVWVPDDAAKACYKCQDTFTLISRRHHCRVCGLLVCGKCSRILHSSTISHSWVIFPPLLSFFIFYFFLITEKQEKCAFQH